jgi:hypothetical protein
LAGHRRNAPVTALARDRRIPLNFSNPAHRLFTRALFYRAFTQDLNPLLTPGQLSLGVFGGSFPRLPNVCGLVRRTTIRRRSANI